MNIRGRGALVTGASRGLDDEGDFRGRECDDVLDAGRDALDALGCGRAVGRKPVARASKAEQAHDPIAVEQDHPVAHRIRL